MSNDKVTNTRMKQLLILAWFLIVLNQYYFYMKTVSEQNVLWYVSKRLSIIKSYLLIITIGKDSVLTDYIQRIVEHLHVQ